MYVHADSEVTLCYCSNEICTVFWIRVWL